MKKNMLLLLLLFGGFYVNAQNLRDVVYLKNGSVIRGKIIEQVPPASLKIQTADSSIFSYRYEEVEKITREQLPDFKPNMAEYGGHLGLGFATGGGGLIGIPVRVGINRYLALETGVFLRPSLIYRKTTVYDFNGNQISEKEESDFRVPPVIAGGADIFFSMKYKPLDQKIIRNGLTVRLGATILKNYKENMFCLGWARERFRLANKRFSYNFNLGAGVLYYGDGNSPLGEQIGEHLPVMPFVYWKFHWNWYVVK